MADAGDNENLAAGVDTNAPDALNEALNGVNETTEKGVEVTRKYRSILSSIGTGGVEDVGKLGASWMSISKLVDSGSMSLKGFQKSLNGLDFSKTLNSINSSFNKLKRSGANMAMDLVEQFDDFTKEANKSVSGLSDVATASGVAIGAALNTGLAQQIAQFKLPGLPQFGKLEENINKVHKIALQTGIAFDGSFNKAAGTTRTLNDVIVSTQENLLGTAEKAQEVAGVLGKGMGAKGAIQPILQLSDAQNQFTESLSTTEAAMAIAMATGTDSVGVAKNMVTAYQELGETVEGSAQMFGTIQSAAKESGIGFEKTMDSIMKGAGALKLWGGTVESVTPIFNAFSKSLKDSGIGRQGLTPELFEKFVGGIKEMSFETRALLGITGGMGGGGALEAGLEMEAALEEGPEGMAKVVENLTSTLQKFGGGQVLTREQAREDPALVRQFMVQRRLLQQMLNVSEAEANKMLEMISSTQESGLEISNTMAEEFNNLVSQGKETATQTTSTLDKAASKQNAAIQKMSEAVVGELKNQLKGSTFTKVMGGLQKDLSRAIRTGRPGMGATRRALGQMTGRGQAQRRRRKQRDLAAGVTLPKTVRKGNRPDRARRAMRDRAELPMLPEIKLPPKIDINTDPIVNKLDEMINVQTQIKEGLTGPTPAPTLPEIEPISVNAEMPELDLPLPPAPTLPEIDLPLPPAPPDITPIEEQIETAPTVDKNYFSVDRAMEQFRKMRAADRGETVAPTEAMAADAIDRASTAAMANRTDQDIEQVTTATTEQRIRGEAELPATRVGGERPGAEPGGALAAAEPVEHEVKIKVTLDRDTIKLDTSMLEDFVTLRANG